MRAWWGFKSEGGLTISLPWYTTLSWSFREKFGEGNQSRWLKARASGWCALGGQLAG